MVPSSALSASNFDCVDLSAPNNSNTRIVDGNFQEKNCLKSSVSSLVRRPGTCTDHLDNIYGAKNSQRKINFFSVRGSETREKKKIN